MVVGTCMDVRLGEMVVGSTGVHIQSIEGVLHRSEADGRPSAAGWAIHAHVTPIAGCFGSGDILERPAHTQRQSIDPATSSIDHED